MLDSWMSTTKIRHLHGRQTHVVPGIVNSKAAYRDFFDDPDIPILKEQAEYAKL